MAKFGRTSAVAASVIASSSIAAAVSPIEKVVEMMGNMLEKGKQEKHEEQVRFAAFKQFCDDTRAEREHSIAEGNQRIELLNADVAKADIDAKHLAKAIANHAADIAIWEGDRKAATSVRGIEKGDYDVMHTDYTESINALESAVKVLKQPRNRKQLPSLVQLKHLNLIPETAKAALDLFMQQDPEANEDLISVPEPALLQQEPNAYEAVSGKIVEMLEKLLHKFQDERLALEKEELGSKHAYEVLMQELQDELKEGASSSAWKSEMKAKRLQEKATAEGDLEDTRTQLGDDQAYLDDMAAQCHTKSVDYDQRQQLRAEEIKVIEQAISIISSDEVAGSAEKHLPTMLQLPVRPGSSLAQLRSAANAASPAQEHAAHFLQSKATQIQSRILSALVSHVASDPLAKVKKLINDLIIRLMEQANDEAVHKGWCDTELGTNAQIRTEKSESVELLRAEIDELEASVVKVAEDLKVLTGAVAELDEGMVTATKLRDEERAKNQATMVDAAAGETAVAQALRILKDFYAKASDATSLLQRDHQEPPATFNQPYQGMEGGGIIGMLEVIESDFARLAAATDGAEDAAQSEHDGFIQDSKVDKTAKSSAIEHKTAKKQGDEHKLVSKKSDLTGTEKELSAALKYFDELKPSCVGSEESYADRVERRESEIQSLKEALTILSDAS